MITNERQYSITRAAVERFEGELKQMQAASPPPDTDPRLWEAAKDALQSQLDEMQAEMARYKALREGRVKEVEVTSMLDIPEVLIAARLATGLTQKQLADRLGVREQQIQHDEATRYAGASLERLHNIAFVLGVTLLGRAGLPRRGQLPEIPSVEELLAPTPDRATVRQAG